MISLSTMEDAFMGLEDDDMASSKNVGSKDPDAKDMEDQASDQMEG
jgi:hypothetical protein